MHGRCSSCNQRKPVTDGNVEYHRGAGCSKADRLGAISLWGSALCLFFQKHRSTINRKDEGLHMTKKVGIIMGSASDLPVVKKAMDTLSSLQIPFEAHI